MAAIESWELTTSRNINYRSFEPILRLVDVFDTPQVQHWAVWALANLTTGSYSFWKLKYILCSLLCLALLCGKMKYPNTEVYYVFGGNRH